MAYDLILKPNTLNLSQVSGPGPYGPAQGPAQRPSQRPDRDHDTAYPQLQDFTRRLNTFNRTLSAWYAQNSSNPAAKNLANTFTAFRDKAYGYIKAYTPGLSTRFLVETPPKELELQAFYKRFLAVSGIAPGQLAASTPQHIEAYVQLQEFTADLNRVNRAISAWYAQNTANAYVRKLANDFTDFRDKAYGYIRAYTPGLAERFLKETPPKIVQLQAFHKRLLKLSDVAPGQPTPTPAPSPGLPAFGIRTARSKARSASPKTSSSPAQEEASPTSPPVSPPVSLPEGMNKGLLIAGGLAALGGIFLVARNSSSTPSPRAPAYRPARTTKQIYSAKQF